MSVFLVLCKVKKGCSWQGQKAQSLCETRGRHPSPKPPQLLHAPAAWQTPPYLPRIPASHDCQGTVVPPWTPVAALQPHYTKLAFLTWPGLCPHWALCLNTLYTLLSMGKDCYSFFQTRLKRPFLQEAFPDATMVPLPCHITCAPSQGW